MWPPKEVVKTQRRHAGLVYVCLLLGFAGYISYVVVKGLQKRQNPATTSQTTTKHTWQLPDLGLCFTGGHGCVSWLWNKTASEYEFFGDDCAAIADTFTKMLWYTESKSTNPEKVTYGLVPHKIDPAFGTRQNCLLFDLSGVPHDKGNKPPTLVWSSVWIPRTSKQSDEVTPLASSFMELKFYPPGASDEDRRTYASLNTVDLTYDMCMTKKCEKSAKTWNYLNVEYSTLKNLAGTTEHLYKAVNEVDKQSAVSTTSTTSTSGDSRVTRDSSTTALLEAFAFPNKSSSAHFVGSRTSSSTSATESYYSSSSNSTASSSYTFSSTSSLLEESSSSSSGVEERTSNLVSFPTADYLQSLFPDTQFGNFSKKEQLQYAALNMKWSVDSWTKTIIAEVDPLEIATLLGTIGGFWAYVGMVFGLLYAAQTRPVTRAMNLPFLKAKDAKKASLGNDDEEGQGVGTPENFPTAEVYNSSDSKSGQECKRQASWRSVRADPTPARKVPIA